MNAEERSERKGKSLLRVTALKDRVDSIGSFLFFFFQEATPEMLGNGYGTNKTSRQQRRFARLKGIPVR